MFLVGYDGSETARHALREAATLLSERDALVVTVWEAGLGLGTTLVPTGLDTGAVPLDPEAAREVDDALSSRARRVSQEGVALAESLGLQARAEIVEDDSNVADTLVHLAEQRGARTIVVGSRGLGGLRKALLGSVSDKVSRHAHCAVLVVHAPRSSD